MDIARPQQARKKRIRRILYISGVAAGVILITVFLSRLEPAAPSVDRAVVWTDKVKRGEMVRNVRGPGRLVPEETRWIPARTEGRVERIILRPGAVVEPSTAILELSNPELEQQVQEARLALLAAEAELTDLKVQLESEVLDQEAVAAAAKSAYEQAELQARADQSLFDEGLLPDLTNRLSKLRAEQAAHRNEIEEQRLEKKRQSVEAQLSAKRATVEQLKAQYELRLSQQDSLTVRAGMSGVLQQLDLDEGQQVSPGMNLARVANPTHLKAELDIAQTQAKDIQLGQRTAVDTRNGIVPGRVVRIDPAVQEGTVKVDVALQGELPAGARPDLSVEGIIEIERLADALFMQRPAFGQAHSRVGLFKLLADGKTAVRVPVELGRSSVNEIEIVSGLEEGDEIILSDMSNYDSFDKVRLN